MRTAEWHPHSEHSPLVDDAFDRHRALVQFDQFLDQSETDARSLMCAPRAPSTRWNRSKILGTSDSGMPVPVSLMRTTA